MPGYFLLRKPGQISAKLIFLSLWLAFLAPERGGLRLGARVQMQAGLRFHLHAEDLCPPTCLYELNRILSDEVQVLPEPLKFSHRTPQACRAPGFLGRHLRALASLAHSPLL